ncbi:uncharacterized protein MONBRDRAFT_22281 [Monosiga brevicollis MX1]|uniref:Armadillo repeat-containing protein 6 n=1 Tax=Monosiga brevicollis TaxID=81824 RepID=A9UQ41_MONBE|nr:uncharacterized protein MONBRDRAFT_22281 [Monosiga brevicollis MX1]EDQ92530.1 predicted protein [Monosiga brevicollis MX1]|eukprot:XP_001742292.1 hypothetical protein [Monosiga brevicollis MX1]
MASKRITQETFNEVVQENIKEFEMELEDAVNDAVEQFESQGVDLTNIRRDEASVLGSGIPVVVTVLQRLRATMQQSEGEGEPVVTDLVLAQAALSELRAELERDPAAKTILAQEHGFPALLAAIEALCHAELPARDALHTALQVMAQLLTGQPDLVTRNNPNNIIGEAQSHPHAEKLCRPLRRFPQDGKTQQHGIHAIRQALVMHETNRQTFVAEGLIDLLLHVLQTHEDQPDAVAEAAHCLRDLTLDDDIRVAFGKAHDHAKLIVSEHNALPAILQAIETFAADDAVLQELCSTLARLAVRNEYCRDIVALGGLRSVLGVLARDDCSSKLASAGLGVLKAIAGNDEVKLDIHSAQGIPVMLTVMNKYAKKTSVMANGCAALTACCLRCRENAASVVANGGANTVVKALIMHPDSARVAKEACRALRNLAARNPDLHDAILAEGAENLINIAMSKFKDCQDDAKAALRDLGCKVELKELWKGAPRDTQEEIEQ